MANKKDSKESGKTYVVYQDRYSYFYNVYDPSDGNDTMPDESDITDRFEAHDGYMWTGYADMTFRIDEDTLEDTGFTIESLKNLDSDRLNYIVMHIFGGNDFYDFEEASGITDSDTKMTGAYVNGEDEDGIVVVAQVNYCFWLQNGEVKCSVIK